MNNNFYVTTPIYYVNDVPHIGHIYSTLIADVASRLARYNGKETFFLTGTDEHSSKVIDAAQKNLMTTENWANKNSKEFRRVFDFFKLSYNDFIRTSEDRHKDEVKARVQQLISSDIVYLGEYKGWYDTGQEEYVTASKAKDSNYLSPISGKPLVERIEENYFFRLSKYQDQLLNLLESEELLITPSSRKNEIISRVKDGLNDIPISRISSDEWGIRIPGDEEHQVYVWIDALLNYITAINTDSLRQFWPASLQVIGKDILWFHAVIWPSILLALQDSSENKWLQLPERIIAHGFWTYDGVKMSKSLGNFISSADLESYSEKLSIDAVRLYLIMNGPLRGGDTSFSEKDLYETYNAYLANTVGNCFSRVTSMITRYYDGVIPTSQTIFYQDFSEKVSAIHRESIIDGENLDFDKMTAKGIAIYREIDSFIQKTEPYKLAKSETNKEKVGEILYRAVDAIRLGATILTPVMPNKMSELLKHLDIDTLQVGNTQLTKPLPNLKIEPGKILFPRYEIEYKEGV